MDTKLLTVTAIAVAVLIVALISLAFAYSSISLQQSSSPSFNTSTATVNPTDNTELTSTPEPTHNQPATSTEHFSLNYTIDHWNPDGSPSVASVAPVKTLASGIHEFDIVITNLPPNHASPKPCLIRLTVTEVGKSSVSTEDVWLGIYTWGEDILGRPTAMYAYYATINGTANGNNLTYLFSPTAGAPSSSGFIVSSDANALWQMKIDLEKQGEYILSLDIVPAV